MMTRVCASSAPKRLVEQQDLGSGGERPHDADALLHAARQPVRVVVLEGRQACEAEQGAAARSRSRRSSLHLEAELDILAHGLPGKQ
jgi:hypothetical protein